MDEAEIENFILMHSSTYDPVKAREYYLRTRELKGRTPGAQDRESSGRNGTGNSPTNNRQKSSKPKIDPKRRREMAKARLEALKAKLERLQDILKLLTAQAKARSGVETEKKDDKKSSDSSSSKTPEKKTAAEKKEAAEKAKEDYEEKKKPSVSDETDQVREKIEKIQEKIADLRKELRLMDSKEKSKNKVENQKPVAVEKKITQKVYLADRNTQRKPSR